MIKKFLTPFFISVVLLALQINSSKAQITTDPVFPIEDQPVTINFNTEGTGLNGYSGELYAHTGVILQGSSSWSHVIGDWGNNTNQPQLTNLGGGIYTLEITPDIKSFYSVGASSTISQLAFVFRSGDAGSQTADLFVDLYEAELSTSVVSPGDQSVYESGEDVAIQVNSFEATSMSLFIDDMVIETSAGDEILYTYTTTDGTHEIKVTATDGTETVSDSVSITVRADNTIAELPDNLTDGINYIDETTVGLVLYAPYKEFIYVIGDFTNWDLNNDYLMNKTPDGNYFWILLENLTPGQEYIYQYYIDAEIRIADPYSEKISDPWNDHDIPSSNYPDLIEYPNGLTSEIATVIQTNQDEYEWQIENFVAPAKENLVIYELLVRDFTDERNFNTLMDSLDYLQTLGVNAIEFMPVNEFEGNNSWGYNPSFYFAVDKYYGSKNDFKALVDECHSRGMAVIFDIVLNHSYGASPMVRMYFEGGKPSALNPWYNRDHNFTNTDAHWGYDFNHESVATQNFIDSVNNYWLTEYKVDGFRFDFTKGFTNEIKDASDPWGSNYDASRIELLKRMSDAIWENHPNAIVSFEHLSVNSEEKVLAEHGILLWGNMNHNFNEGTMGWIENGKSDIRGASYKSRGWDVPHLIAYAESHDEQRLMYKNLQYGNSTVAAYDLSSVGNAVERMELVPVFLMSIPGPKMIWQFGELGYDIDINFNGRVGIKPTKWEYYDDWRRKYLYDIYAVMIDLAVNNPIFDAEEFEVDGYGPLKRIKLNAGAEGMAIIIGNWDIEEAHINPDFYAPGTWYEYFTGEVKEVSDVNEEILLQPGEYRIYFDREFETPDIPVGEPEFEGSSQLKLYPNPGNGDFILNLPEIEGDTSIKLYAINGQLINVKEMFIAENSKRMRLDFSEMNSGVYILELSNNGYRQTGKLVIN